LAWQVEKVDAPFRAPAALAPALLRRVGVRRDTLFVEHEAGGRVLTAELRLAVNVLRDLRVRRRSRRLAPPPRAGLPSRAPPLPRRPQPADAVTALRGATPALGLASDAELARVLAALLAPAGGAAAAAAAPPAPRAAAGDGAGAGALAAARPAAPVPTAGAGAPVAVRPAAPVSTVVTDRRAPALAPAPAPAPAAAARAPATPPAVAVASAAAARPPAPVPAPALPAALAGIGDLQRAGPAALALAKSKMDVVFDAHRSRPGAADFVYDKRVEVKPVEASEWDDE